MFTFKKLNKKVNRIHENSLRLVLNNHQSALDEMLDTLSGNSPTMHWQFADQSL